MPSIPIGITGWGSLSPLGAERSRIWTNYRNPQTAIVRRDDGAPVAPLEARAAASVEAMRQKDKRYQMLDRSVLMAMLAAAAACGEAGWTPQPDFGVNIGSSRGATERWESHHRSLLDSSGGRLSPLASPTTTLGNIASWVAHHLGATGPAISHSITCSTALHALLNAVVWLEAGRSRRFLVGGSEAPLTTFTIAQMQALRIYADGEVADYPCRAGDQQKSHNSMVLGEGAACFCLEAHPGRPLAWIESIGYGTERAPTSTGMTAEADCLQRSMAMALAEAGRPAVDVVVSHTPGTVLGDRAELRAIHRVFGANIPALTNNKWKIGHTLGASGALSLEMALLMLQHGQLVEVPYLRDDARPPEGPVRRVLVNAAGFGGNAVSVLLKAP